MFTMNQGKRRNKAAGKPIPLPWKVFTDTESHIRRGQLTMICAGPGTGKSAVAQALAQRGDDDGNVLQTLYFSADSDANTLFKRAAAIATGWQMNDIDRLIREGNDQGLEAAVQDACRHMRMDFRSSLSDQDLLDEIDAYAAVYGAYPELIVVDNLTNVYIDGVESERQGLQAVCTLLHDIARDTNAAVITLHHVGGMYEGESRVIPLSGVKEKLSKTPEVIWTMYRDVDRLNVSIVKNRNGVAFADGSNPLTLHSDLSRMQIG